MSAVTSIDEARKIFGSDLIGPEELRDVFGAGVERAASVPFAAEELRVARKNGELLILRLASGDGQSLTLQSLISRFPDAFDQAFLRKVGYQLRDEWGIELEPLTATETCSTQWALVQPVILPETRNLSYDEQAPQLEEYGRRRGTAGKLRRRTAIEIGFDTIALHRARNVRLLETSWDWSSTRTLDGGYLNLGRFTNQGLQVFSYSKAVRHGQLGVCPNRDPD